MAHQMGGFTIPYRNVGVTHLATTLKQRGVNGYLPYLPSASQFTVIHHHLTTAGVRAYELLGMVGSSNRTCATITVISNKMSTISFGENMADAVSSAATESNVRFPWSLQGVWPFELLRQGAYVDRAKGLCAILKLYFLAQGVVSADEVIGYDSNAFFDELCEALRIVHADVQARRSHFNTRQARNYVGAQAPQLKVAQHQYIVPVTDYVAKFENETEKTQYRVSPSHAEMGTSYRGYQPATPKVSHKEHTMQPVTIPASTTTAAAPASYWTAYPNAAINCTAPHRPQYPAAPMQSINPNTPHHVSPPNESFPPAQVIETDPTYQELHSLLDQGEGIGHRIAELKNQIARFQEEVQRLSRSKDDIEQQFNKKCQSLTAWQMAHYVGGLAEVGKKNGMGA